MTTACPRVLHVLEASGHGGGTARHLLDLVAHLPELDHHVVLPVRPASRGEPVSDLTADLLRGLGAVVHQLPMRRQPLHPDTLRGAAGLQRIVRRVLPDLVHGHSAIGGALARLMVGPPTVYTPNGIHPSSAARMIERRLADRMAAAIAVSNGEAELLVERLGVPPERVHVVPNGIADLVAETGHPVPALPVPAEVPVVGWVGRHARQKAPEILIRAAARVCNEQADVHVVMVGGGPQLSRSRALVHDLGLADRVHLLGFVADARRLMGQVDVLALPSRWEGAPYAPLEAMAAKVPLVLSNCVGNADLVQPGRTGWMVDVDDAEGLAAAILEALRDPAEAAARAAAAFERFETGYRASHMARGTRDVYDAVLDGS